MKKLIYSIVAFISLVLYSCVYDPPRGGSFIIGNNSDKAVYVCLVQGDIIDSLPLSPALKLFDYFDNNDERFIDAQGNPLKSRFVSPEYRIDAYDVNNLYIAGDPNNLKFWSSTKQYYSENATLFFITEETMRNCEWEDIYRNQMYVKRVIVTEKELKKNNWTYVYEPN